MKRIYIFLTILSLLFFNACTVFKKKSSVVPLQLVPLTAEICYADVPFTSYSDIEIPAINHFYIDFDSFYLSIMDTSCPVFYEIPGIKHLTTNQKLTVFLSKWMNTRYRRGGKSQAGTDCSGFVNSLYKEVYNINLSRSSYTMINDVVKIPKSELKEGDLVFFKIRKGRISHVGFYLSNGYFVHAARRGGVIVSSLNEPYYLRTYYAAGRVKF